MPDIAVLSPFFGSQIPSFQESKKGSEIKFQRWMVVRGFRNTLGLVIAKKSVEMVVLPGQELATVLGDNLLYTAVVLYCRLTSY